MNSITRAVFWIGLCLLALIAPGRLLFLLLPGLTALGPGFSTLSLLVIFVAFCIAATAIILATGLIWLGGGLSSQARGSLLQYIAYICSGSVLFALGCYRLFFWEQQLTGQWFEDTERKVITWLAGGAMFLGGMGLCAVGLFQLAGFALIGGEEADAATRDEFH